MLSADWLVMLNADGTVIGVDGGAPTGWVSRRVDNCAEMPGEVREAARRLLRDLRRPLRPTSIHRSRIAPAAPGEPAFTLLANESIPLWPEDVDLVPLIHRLLAPMMRQAESMNVSLSIHCTGEIPIHLAIDVAKIGWAVSTLVGSALRHVRRGSDVAPGGHVQVRMTHNAHQRLVSITVEDDGPGISENMQPWLFEPDPETGRAVGVALLMVHQVVTAHGGGVVVKSPAAKGKQGTAVTLCLPTRSL